MKKRFFVGGVLFFIPIYLFSNDFSMINLYSPTHLERRYLNFSVRHRFYGDVTDAPFKNFFGIDAGANVHLALRYQIIQNIELKTSYTRRKKEKTVGLSYKMDIQRFPIVTQMDLTYFSFKEGGLIDETRSNFLAIVSMQNRPVADRLVGTVNVGYDGYYERFLLGIGLSVSIVRDLGIFQQISLLCEYYPVLDRENADSRLNPYIGSDNGFSLALKMDTYGHRFFILVTNTDDLHFHRTALGVPEDSHWRLGFNIERKLKL